MSLQTDIHQEHIRKFAAEVVLRSIRDRKNYNVYAACKRQGYLMGVLDVALRESAITQEENQKALGAVQGECFDEIWW